MKKKPRDPIGYFKYVLAALALLITLAFVAVMATGCSPQKEGCKENRGFVGYGSKYKKY